MVRSLPEVKQESEMRERTPSVQQPHKLHKMGLTPIPAPKPVRVWEPGYLAFRPWLVSHPRPVTAIRR